MGLFRRATPIDPAEVGRMKAEITSLREAMERHGALASSLGGRVDELASATSDPSARLDELDTQLAALDARVTSVATELANQLSELGGEIESLSNRPAGDGVDEGALGEIRDGQVRLANEQVRYQIAFRDDLARLAEQLRRPPT
ncbi:MAG: hypothetical protein H0U21_01890 [Acidimicrobiia bacterium]|nr:hypothetical protein [Acidimicrobiia bacterium]